jgi:NADPH:quinone reductase-like Zn-dependent oxidoreductase
MKAVRYHSYGDSSVLVYEEADRPVAGAGQVVVRVTGAAFNPVDVAIRAGFMNAGGAVGGYAVHDQSAAGQLPGGKTVLIP